MTIWGGGGGLDEDDEGDGSHAEAEAEAEAEADARALLCLAPAAKQICFKDFTSKNLTDRTSREAWDQPVFL